MEKNEDSQEDTVPVSLPSQPQERPESQKNLETFHEAGLNSSIIATSVDKPESEPSNQSSPNIFAPEKVDQTDTQQNSISGPKPSFDRQFDEIPQNMHFQNLNTKNEPIQYSQFPASQNPHTLNFDSAAQTPQEQFLNRTGGSLGHMPANQSLTGGYNYQTPTFPPNPPPEFNVNAPQGPLPMAFPATNFYVQPQNHNVSQNSHYSHQYTNMHPQFWSPGYQQSYYSGMYPNSFFGQNYWPAPPVLQHYPIHGLEYAGNFPSNPNNSMISVSSSMAGHQQIPPYPQTQNFMHFQTPSQQPFLGHYLPQNQGNYNLWNPAQNSFMNNSGFGNQLPHWHQNNQNFSSRVINIPTESKHEESVRASSCQEIGVDQIRLENHKFFQTKSENLLVDLLEDLQENKEQADELSQPKMPENFAKDRRNSFSNFPCLKYDKNQICQIIRYTEVSEQGVLNGKHFVSEFEILKFSSLLQMGAECQVARIDKMEGIQIDFETLAKFNVRFLGIFGRLNLILQALADNKLIEKSEIQDFGQHFTDAGTGLFAIPLKVEADETLVLLVLYTAEEDDLNAISDRRGFVRMLRYLTQLCNYNIMCLDRSDLEKITFQKEGKQARHTRFIPQINQIVNDSCTLGKKN
jgi:hypothetical protein